MLGKFKSLIGFGRKEVEWYEEIPPDYGVAVAMGFVAFRIGHIMEFCDYWKCDYPFFIQVNYLINGPYSKEQRDLCIVYENGSGWFIDIPYLDLTLDKWDFKAFFKAVKKKAKGEIIPDGFRNPLPNIYIDNREFQLKELSNESK